MKLFIDSGNLREIEALVPLGIIDGVTTNPSLMAKEGGDPRAIIKQICRLVQGPVSAEVVATDAAGMIARRPRAGGHRRARRRQGAVHARRRRRRRKTLAAEGMRVNVTLIFSATQALFAAKVGAAVRQPVRRPARRHRLGRHGAHPADRRHLPALRLHDRDARRQRPSSDAHRRGRAHGRATSARARRRSSRRASSIRSPTSASRSS